MRTHRVKSARKPQGNCGKCGDAIPAGAPYIWWKFRYAGARKRCTKPACAPKPADLTQSEFYGSLLTIEDTLNDAVALFQSDGDAESCAQTFRDAAEELRNLGAECEDKRSNMPDALQDSDTGSLLEERASECESKADELDEVADSLDTLHDAAETVADYIEEEGLTANEGESAEDFAARAEQEWEDSKQDRINEVDLDFDLSIS